MPPAAILDVDGTLVDSNYQHALAWYRALRQHDVVVPVARCHRAVGMGSDELIRDLAGDEVADELGESISAAHSALYRAMLHEIEPIPGARRLLRDLRERGHLVVIASSAKQRDLDHFLDLLDARDVAHGWTGAGDVDRAKPEPDLIGAALAEVGAEEGVMVGDSVWDVRAAAKIGVATIGVTTGGTSAAELTEAGATVVFPSVEELRLHLGETPLGA